MVPLILALERQKQIDLCESRDQLGLQSKFQDSHGSTEKSSLKNQTNKKEVRVYSSVVDQLPSMC